MSFRRTSNAHDNWLILVRENMALLGEIPAAALENEQAFRDYVTHSAHQGSVMSPQVSSLSNKAIEDLATFFHQKAQFDMDTILFESFNNEYRLRHLQQISIHVSHT